MESRQYDQASAASAWLPEKGAAVGLLDMAFRRGRNAPAADHGYMVPGRPETDRGGGGHAADAAKADDDDPLAGPPSWEAAVRYFRVRTGRLPRSRDNLIHLLSRDIAELDRCLSEQVDAVLHEPRFQGLEAAWRGLALLVDGSGGGEDLKGGQKNLKVKVLHLPKQQLEADLHGATQFDQSEIFRKVYEQEYGIAGGEPFGALIGNYEFRNSPADIELLFKIKEVAAAAFAPFIAGADPMLFGVRNFGLLPRISSLEEIFGSQKFGKWNALREHDDSRFLGLVLPRILMRLPYTRDSQRVDGFIFEEDVSAADGRSYLWGNAAFAFGNVLIRAFALSGWFADIRGTASGADSGGVIDLPAPIGPAWPSSVPSIRSSAQPATRSSAIWGSLRSAIAKTPRTRRSSATNRCRSRKSTIATRTSTPRPTRGSRRCCSMFSAPRDSPTI
jgi:hypothetical protein